MRSLRSLYIQSGTFLICGALLCHCVSRTSTDQRFRESRALPAPTSSVTLADPERFQFAFVGDLHIAGANTSGWRRVLQAAQAEGDAFVVVLGDIADEGAAADFDAYNQAIVDLGWSGKVFSVIGNHDVFYDGWNSYRDKLGSSAYTLDIGSVRLIALDTADAALGSEQAVWFSEQLKARKGRAIVLSHYLPILPAVESYLKLSNYVESLTLMRTAENQGALAWLGAHFHGYAEQRVGGVQYIAAGGGGGRRMGPFSEYFYVQATVDPAGISFAVKKFP